MAPLLKYCRANAEAMDSNLDEVPKLFRVNLKFLKLQLLLRRSYLRFLKKYVNDKTHKNGKVIWRAVS